MTEWWQAAQGIGAIATAASFIVIFITFIINRKRDRRQHRETYKLAFLEYTQQQKDRLIAFEQRYVKYKADLLGGQPARDVYRGHVERHLRSSTDVSAYELINDMPIFYAEDVLKLANLLGANPLLHSDFRLSFSLGNGVLKRLTSRLRTFDEVIDELEADPITDIFILLDKLFSGAINLNLLLVDWLLAKDSEELFAEKQLQAAAYKRLRTVGGDLYGAALARHRETPLSETIEELDTQLGELDKLLETATLTGDGEGE
jgi:hypothetical protein